MSWPYQVDGVDVFRLPPEGYEVDFDNPRSQKVLDHYLIFGIGAPLAFVALLQRFYTKLYLSKGLQVDDAFMFLGWLSSVLTQLIMTVSIAQGGLCHHSFEMSLKDFEQYSLLVYISAPIYMMCNGFVKISLLTFYLHLSPQKWFRVCTWISIGIVALYTIIITFLMFFNCNPPQKQFDFSVVGGSCIDAAILYMATAVSNIVTDVILFILPIPMVYQLHMPRFQKFGAIIVFGIGSATVATSVVRLLHLPAVLASDDPSWAAAPSNVWTFIEANLFVICGSMPTLRKFFKHFLPRVMGSSGKGSSYAYGGAYANRNPSGGGAVRGSTYGPQRASTISRMRNTNRQYSQFDGTGTDRISEETEMQRLSGEKKGESGATVTVGVVRKDDVEASRDDHSERAILQTKSFTVQYD